MNAGNHSICSMMKPRIAAIAALFSVSFHVHSASIETEVIELAARMSERPSAQGEEGITLLKVTGNGKKVVFSIRKEGDVTNWKKEAEHESCRFPAFRRILMLGGSLVWKTEGTDPRLPMTIVVSASDCTAVGLPISANEPLPQPLPKAPPSSSGPVPAPAAPPVSRSRY